MEVEYDQGTEAAPPVAKMKLWNLLTVYAHYSFGLVAEIALDSSSAIF